MHHNPALSLAVFPLLLVACGESASFDVTERRPYLPELTRIPRPRPVPHLTGLVEVHQ